MGPLCEIYPEIIVIPDNIQTGTYFDTSFTITNIGMGTLVGSVEEACDQFSIVSGEGSYGLLNGQSRVVTIRFEPVEAGTHQCSIETGMYLCCDVIITGTAYTCPGSPVLYVDTDASGSNDGTSWTDAFVSLQDALYRSDLCDNVSEIWVADGTYYPTGGIDRYAGCFGPGFDNACEGLLLMFGITFYRADQVGDQIGPSLVNVFHIGPLSGHSFFQGHKAIIFFHSPQDGDQHHNSYDDPGSILFIHIFFFFQKYSMSCQFMHEW